MKQNIEAIHINPKLNLYVVDTTKFKTDLIGIYIKRRLSHEEASLNALLTRVLMRGTQQYPSSKALNVELEKRYGMILVADVVKYGEYHILQFKLQFPNQKHLPEMGIFDDALGILKEVIFCPALEEGLFNKEYFEQEKANLIDEIESRVNDKMSYSLERCIECMYDQEAYSEYVYGNVERIQEITVGELTEHYHRIIKRSLFDICVMGDVKTGDVQELITSELPIQLDKIDALDDTHSNLLVEQVRNYTEHFAVKQGKLVMGYRTHIDQNDPLYEASVLAYHIYGGGANSKLFNRLREEQGLCYYVFAKSDKFKGGLFIGAGIQSENAQQVQNEISDELTRLRQGSVTHKELQMAKEAMVSSIQSLSDFPNSFINFYYTEVLGRPLKSMDLEDMINAYQSVTLKELQAVYKKLELDTVYLLEGESDGNI